MKFVNNKWKAVLSGIAAGFFIVLGSVALSIGYPVAAVLFFALTLVYLYFIYKVGFIVEINKAGITTRFLSRQIAEYQWKDIREIGITPISPFKRKGIGKPGQLSFYCAKTILTSEERLDMVMKWPPSKELYIDYSDQVLQEILRHWNGKIILFNVTRTQLFKDASLLRMDQFTEVRY